MVFLGMSVHNNILSKYKNVRMDESITHYSQVINQTTFSNLLQLETTLDKLVELIINYFSNLISYAFRNGSVCLQDRKSVV